MKLKSIVVVAFIAFLAGSSSSASAQNSVVVQPIAGSMLSPREIVQSMQLNAPSLYRSYRSGRVLSNLGKGLTIGGGVLAIVGAATAETSTTTTGTSTTVNLSGPGGAVCAVGVFAAITGGTLWIIGGAKKRHAYNAYRNEYGSLDSGAPAPYFQFRPTSDGFGMGLALVF
jgi:hypothetical protein